MKPKVIYRCLPNYSEDGKYYMYPSMIQDAMPWNNSLIHKCYSYGVVYGPIVIGYRIA